MSTTRPEPTGPEPPGPAGDVAGPPAPAPAAATTSAKACHNCRRRRLRCDRSVPHCNKCRAVGAECLGYGKLFRWTGAVASRGKLAGRPSSAPVDAAATPGRSSAGGRGQGGRGAESAESAGPENAGPENAGPEAAGGSPPATQLAAGRPSFPWVLADPLFQDVDASHRYYLSYFTQRLCKDLVSYDVADRNPFRGLLPLTRAQPLLQHVIVAASAAHMANLIRAPLCWTPGAPALPPASADAARRAARDGLVAKHRALTLMRAAVDDVDAAGPDVVLAAVLFFINAELIESGRAGWKAHLEAAGRIMALLRPASAANAALRDYMLSDCFCYFILASAFNPSATFNSGSFFRPSLIPGILERAAANSYLCCPPEILETLYAASQLSNAESAAGDGAITAAGLALLRRAQAFDIETWATNARSVSYLQHTPIQSRIHAGSAHRLATCLYALQAIPSLSSVAGHDALADALSDELVFHLSSVPGDDPNFKATTWPTFIAGAEANARPRRQWCMDRLRELVVSCPWGFIYTAMDVLHVIWALDGPGRRSWVQTLKDPSFSLLIV